MLFKLALGNLRRSFHSYWAYFLSSAFSVFVLYLFLTVVYGKNAGGSVMYQSTAILFGIGSVLAAMFAAFFIWYSNSFFVKSRKKEFATYMLLGMSKGQTMLLSFLESFVILALAYAAGIAAGILLDKFLIMLLFVIMQEKAYVPFEINVQALRLCSIIYGSVFLLILLHSAWLLRKNSLIELINASRKSEKGMKVSAWTFVVGLLAIGFLGMGYFIAVALGSNPLFWPVIVLFVCVGTALLFTGLATVYFHLTRRNEKTLYKGIRLVTVSQLMHRYRGNVGALTVIAITTSVALCAVLTCCGMFSRSADSARIMNPFSVQYTSSEQSEGIFNEAVKAHPEVSVLSRSDVKLLDARVNSLNGKKEDYAVYLISQTNYNDVLKAQGRTDLANLPDDSSCLYVQFFQNYSNKQALEEKLGKSIGVAAGGKTLNLTVAQTSTRIFMSLSSFIRTVVVTDSVYDSLHDLAGVQEFRQTGYMLQNDIAAGAFADDLTARMKELNDQYEKEWESTKNDAELKAKFCRLETYYDNYMDNLKGFGVLMFVGVFIGLLFIVATGGILYFRMATEASDDREKFATLLKIGMSAKELRAAVAKELAVIFGVPLAVAAANTFFASYPLENLVGFSMKGAFVLMLAVYAMLYGLYFLLSLRKYVKTVSGQSA